MSTNPDDDHAGGDHVDFESHGAVANLALDCTSSLGSPQTSAGPSTAASFEMVQSPQADTGLHNMNADTAGVGIATTGVAKMTLEPIDLLADQYDTFTNANADAGASPAQPGQALSSKCCAIASVCVTLFTDECCVHGSMLLHKSHCKTCTMNSS